MSPAERTDVQIEVAVIGAGPGGYVAAIRAAQLGLRVAVIEKEFVGGTCLNVGCIPSKALLDASHLFSQIRKASAFGIQVEGASVDFAGMQRHKARVVKTLTAGVRGLLKRHGVEQLTGTARFDAPGVLAVRSPDGPDLTVRADNVIVATGSVEAQLPGVPFDDTIVISSRGALELEALPDRLVIVGAGYIGLELGSVYSRLGTEVVVLEMMDRILPEMDVELADAARKLLEQQGLDIRLGAKVSAVDVADDSALVRYSVDDSEEAVEATRVLISIGRQPATEGLGLDAIGLQTDDRGFIMVDHGMRTGLPGVYAIGDIVATPMLAHVAMDEGVVAAECIAGGASAMEYDAIPAVVFTHPELASVGLKEDEAELRGHKLKVGRFPFRGNGRARARDDMEGWVKVIADADTDVILGVHCIGPEAGHLIHEAVVAMGYGGYSEDLALTVHAHPTLSEAFKEAALAVDGRPLHI
ncbi:MAG TPA: dihydrolipoyl dehydrogenase [Acidobacteriota bacterium]|nr:dihydrolipoyl dehydrogenase [Acidobacteriota bacterium]